MTVVGSASDGLSGVELVQSLAPDLVLMDLSMPVLGGLEATRRIKEISPAPRVVILTLHDNQEYRRSAYESGADGFVSKSGLTAALPALVEALFPGMERGSGVRTAGENEHEQ